MADFYLRKGDLLPRIKATLKYSTGNAIDLSGATVRFRMWRAATPDALVVDGVATIVDATAGKVEYAFASGDTDATGQFEASWRILVGSFVMHVPNDRPLCVSVAAGG